MKVILRGYGENMNSQQRQVAKATARDMLLTRGTGNKPLMPRDVIATTAPRGVLLNWRAPAKNLTDITGYRVYKDDENSLFAEIRDPGTTQHFVESTAAATSPTTNFFVSTINKLGVESAKVQVQSAAVNEAGAPATPMPSTPPTYAITYSPQTFGVRALIVNK